MIKQSSRNICLVLSAGLALSACSASSGTDRYGSYDGYSDQSAGYYDGAQGYQSAMGEAGCETAQGQYQGQYQNQGGGRYGGGYNTDGSGATLRRSRYGSAEYSEYGYAEYGGSRYGGAQAGMAGDCGYWVIPTYQVADIPTPPTVTPPTVTTSTPPITVVPETVCEDGQYKMANGNCAIMMTEEPPQYTPPVSYPEPPRITPEYYQPIRK